MARPFEKPTLSGQFSVIGACWRNSQQRRAPKDRTTNHRQQITFRTDERHNRVTRSTWAENPSEGASNRQAFAPGHVMPAIGYGSWRDGPQKIKNTPSVAV
jgi:hypothetical protein